MKPASTSPDPITESDMKTLIAKAKAAGKLDKPVEKWLIEHELPRLHWLSGAELSDEELRFLMYRQTLSKEIRIDPENKAFLKWIDKTRSSAFAQALLKAFIANGAEAKAKYFMPLATTLGGDEEIDLLKAKVNEWVNNARGKMAEFAVKAIALNGSNKALRLIEFYARKFKSKNRNIGAAANEAFELAAEELGIPPYELADAIIPDFGFEGLFRAFELGGESYRAFVSNDFKILFLNEDNKLLKSLPKGTDAGLAAEFKEMAKEIRDIVKSQSSRLEQYLVIQRRWEAAKWQQFFLGNPVMFAYAVRLIWGAYDADGRCLFTFRCTEDQELLDQNGEEVALEEIHQIGMVHPIDLDENSIRYWKENLFDSDVEPIFPQLSRPVFLLPEEDRNTRLGKHFYGIEIGGYTLLGRMNKSGWLRGSVVDGGGISSYYKDFPSYGITVILEQTGIHSVGYYEANAELGHLMFVQYQSVQIGSYNYDEPRDAQDKRLIPFGAVPALVYSEVMGDLQVFKGG